MSGDLPILRICFRFHMLMLSLLMLSINAYSFSKASLGLDQVNALTSERSKVPSSFFSSPVYFSNEEVTTRDLSSLRMFNYISAFSCSITSFGIPAPASHLTWLLLTFPSFTVLTKIKGDEQAFCRFKTFPTSSYQLSVCSVCGLTHLHHEGATR